MPEKNRPIHLGSPADESGAAAGGPSTEEKILEAHTLMTRIFAATGATGVTPSFTGAQGPQYRFSFYYPAAAGWPSTSTGTSWSWPAEASASWSGQPMLGQPLGLPTPFGFMGFR